MNDREQAKLSYVAQALAGAPRRYEELLTIAANGASADFERVLGSFKARFAEKFPPNSNDGKSDYQKLTTIARALLGAPSPGPIAGRALSWAIENRSFEFV